MIGLLMLISIDWCKVLTNATANRHISRFVTGIKSKCISQFADPVSPHIAAKAGGSTKVRHCSPFAVPHAKLLSAPALR